MSTSATSLHWAAEKDVPFFGDARQYLADLSKSRGADGKLKPKFGIHILEALAFWYSAYFFIRRYNIHTCILHAYIDNQTAECAIRNNRIKWPGIVAAGVAFDNFCSTRSLILQIHRVDTKMNVDADNASRKLCNTLTLQDGSSVPVHPMEFQEFNRLCRRYIGFV